MPAKKKSLARVVIADDDPAFLEQVACLLETRFDVIGCVQSGRELVEMVASLSPDVVVADITMPNLNGLEAAKQITKASRKVKVLMLSGYSEDSLIDAAFAAGASGYVVKLEIFVELIPAIEIVLSGKRYRPNDFPNPRIKVQQASE